MKPNLIAFDTASKTITLAVWFVANTEVAPTQVIKNYLDENIILHGIIISPTNLTYLDNLRANSWITQDFNREDIEPVYSLLDFAQPNKNTSEDIGQDAYNVLMDLKANLENMEIIYNQEKKGYN